MKTFILITATVLSLVAFASVGVEVSQTTQTGRFDLGQDVSLEYRIVPFNKKLFRQNEGKIGPVYGVDGGGVPTTKLEKLILKRGKRTTPLEVSCMYEPALGGMDKRRFRVRVVNPRSVLLTGVFSDAAGSYIAEWLIVDGIGVRTLLSDDPERISRFGRP